MLTVTFAIAQGAQCAIVSSELKAHDILSEPVLGFGPMEWAFDALETGEEVVFLDSLVGE